MSAGRPFFAAVLAAALLGGAMPSVAAAAAPEDSGAAPAVPSPSIAPSRPGLSHVHTPGEGRAAGNHEEHVDDQVVVGPGELDATGRMPDPVVGRRPGSESGASGRAGVPGAVLGARSIVVLRVDYQGDGKQADASPYTVPDIQSRLVTAAGSASGLLSAQSGGAVTLRGLASPAGDVSPWLELPGSVPARSGSCDHAKIAADAIVAAGAKGIDANRYDHVMILFPTSDTCGWSGLGEVPGHTTWINGFYADEAQIDASIVAHELGHNLGVAHASSAICTTAVVATAPTLRACGEIVEYGDPFELMGGGWMDPNPDPAANGAPRTPGWIGTALMSSWHRAQLLQLPAAGQATVTTAGTYTLDEALGTTGTRLLRIPRGTGSGVTAATGELVLEVRSGSTPADGLYPFDKWLGSAPAGVLVRLAPALTSADRSILLDMAPATKSMSDAALRVGSTFTDPLAKITIRLDALTAGRATLTIGGDRLSVPAPVVASPLPPVVTPPAVVVPAAPVIPPGVPPTTPTAAPASPKAPAAKATLVRPTAANRRLVPSNGKVTVAVPGAGTILVKAGQRQLKRTRGAKVTFTLPKRLRTKGSVTVRATGGTLGAPVRATLTIKKRVARLTIAAG